MRVVHRILPFCLLGIPSTSNCYYMDYICVFFSKFEVIIAAKQPFKKLSCLALPLEHLAYPLLFISLHVFGTSLAVEKVMNMEQTVLPCPERAFA